MIQKQAANIPFNHGIDTKSDPKQVAPGKLLSRVNATFNRLGQLTKRNGFGATFSALPVTDSTTLATIGGGLVAAGSSLYTYSANSAQWINQGAVKTAALASKPLALVRSSNGQVACDSAVAPSGLVCTVYTETGGQCYVEVTDIGTANAVLKPTALPSTATNPRVFILGSNFVIVFAATVGGAPHLQYCAISVAKPTTLGAATDLSTQILSISSAFDGVVAGPNLYLAFNGSDAGSAVRLMYLTQALVASSQQVIAGKNASLVTLAADFNSSSLSLYVTFWDSGTHNGWTAVFDKYLVQVLAPVQCITSQTISQLSSIVASSQVVTFAYQVTNSYPSTTRSDYVSYNTCNIGGSVGTARVSARSVGLASKLFTDSGSVYALTSYGGALQPTYFLFNIVTGVPLLKLAYGNGAGYQTTQVLPNVSLYNGTRVFSYLYRNQIQAVNKSQGASSIAGIFAQAGVNLAQVTLNNYSLRTVETAGTLVIAGGIVEAFDGVNLVELGFSLFPEDLTVSTLGTGGALTAQQYYYQVCYEWTDAAGNIQRSAPSVPISITTTGTTSSNTLTIPTLRLTRKNNVRLVVYRWSAAQQSYYQVSSISAPTLNNLSADTVTFVDTLADSAIIGNNLLYTTGAVIEDMAPPASNIITVNSSNSRLFLVSAEDPYTVWYSKQLIEQTPIELSDLFTIYVPPTTGAQGTTGPVTALSSLDDKLILFKSNSICYVTGIGPDNTGASNDLSTPTDIKSTVGCINQASIVATPDGIMFQSDKGIWLLGRDLSTGYIGADVEAYNSATVTSALVIPGTNEVRFTLSAGTALVYDYYVRGWGIYSNLPAVSSCLYNGLHTYLTASGLVYQETPGLYLDGSTPVLMSFTTSWLAVAGLQGYQRAFFFYLLGQYLTPHRLSLSICYDYNSSPAQTTMITPDNYNPAYGSDALYGSSNPYGGPDAGEQWRVFLQNQRCQSIQISCQELFDSSYGTAPGAGLTLSGINLVYGIKSGYTKIASGRSVG